MTRGRRTSCTIRLTTKERQTLLAWQRSTSIPAGRARRARVILLMADRVPISYGQNIRTRFPTGGYAPYNHPRFGLSSSPLSWILTGNMDGKQCGGEAMDWQHLLASITGSVDQELLLRNEYLVTEHRLLRNQLKDRVHLNDSERKTLAEIGKKLSRQTLEDVASIVKPDTILAWHRKLIAQKFDGSAQRKAPGRPKIDAELEALVVHMAQENRSWG